MAARVAHEIRNPLVAIGGFARLLLREAPVDGAMRENIQIIASEVRRLESILREVLDYSNPSPLRLAHIDLARLALEALDLLRWELHEAGIVGSLEAEPGLPEAHADRNQLFQALINVMHNAIQAMPQGGKLNLRAYRKMGALELSVEDTGQGIPPEVRARIFEPFYTMKSTGSGLGLTIAEQILREHRGEIQVDSTVGVGTTFFLRLPVTGEETAHDHVENPGG
jgi:signal transduction histidine kinase